MNDYQTTGGDNQRQEENDPKVHDVSTYIDSTKYSLDLPKITSLFQEAGIHRTARSLQRYCDNGSIDARKYNTEKGSMWLANPKSVELKIKEILELEEAARQMSSTINDTATDDDVSTSQISDIFDDSGSATIDDNQRQSFADADSRAFDKSTDEPTTSDRPSTTDNDNKYVSVPVGVVDALTDQLAEKDRQIDRRDLELKRMGEERNHDRALLSQALHLIHGDSFTPALWGKTETEDPKPSNEIRPEHLNRHQEREGENPTTGAGSDGV